MSWNLTNCCQTSATNWSIAQAPKMSPAIKEHLSILWFKTWSDVHSLWLGFIIPLINLKKNKLWAWWNLLLAQINPNNSSLTHRSQAGSTHLFAVFVISTADRIVPQKEDCLHRLCQSRLAHNTSTHPAVCVAMCACVCARVCLHKRHTESALKRQLHSDTFVVFVRYCERIRSVRLAQHSHCLWPSCSLNRVFISVL